MNVLNQKRDKWLHIRLNDQEHKAIYGKYTQSTCQKLSEYARLVLLNKPVTVKLRNRSLDDFMEEAIRLRNELNAIGNNFNQMVKKLHTLNQIEEFKNWIYGNEKDREILLQKVEEIKQKINSISDKWLQ